MEEYRTEEEQVEALRRWWQENGRSIIAAVIIALAASFSWQTWESSQEGHQEEASTVYEAMLRAIGIGEASVNAQMGVNLAEQLKQNFDGTIYAQFAALHLAGLILFGCFGFSVPMLLLVAGMMMVRRITKQAHQKMLHS